MSLSFNKCILAGYLARDPEMRYTPKGAAVCQFAIGINRTWKNEAGDQMQESSFLDCVAFGKTAETIAQYFKKGSAILVEARAKQESWEDKTTNQKRYATKFIVEQFQFIDSKGGGDGGQREERPATRQPAKAPANRQAPPPDNDGPPPEDDDIPF